MGKNYYLLEHLHFEAGEPRKENTYVYFKIWRYHWKKYSIPVAYCDDFGHGSNHAIFPIGRKAVLDIKNKALFFQ
ncbi:MAG: hypothetical protein HDR13_07230 [Lachnospiraceae bacterium]|nr:hypothetical protein [Lachnospiraceae bacterium]